MSVKILPYEILHMILSYLSFEDLLYVSFGILVPGCPLRIYPNSFVDFSQLIGMRATPIVKSHDVFLSLKRRINKYLVDKKDEFILQDVRFLISKRLLVSFQTPCFDFRVQPGYCYTVLFDYPYSMFAAQCLGSYPTFKSFRQFSNFISLAGLLAGNKFNFSFNDCRLPWCSVFSRDHFYMRMDSYGRAHVQLKPKTNNKKWVTHFMMDDSLDELVVGSPIHSKAQKVCLTEDGIEDEILSLAGGNAVEVGESMGRALNWSNQTNFERSCEARFNALERSIEKILNVVEGCDSVVPGDSASRAGGSRMISNSVLPVIDEVDMTSFSVTHPNWKPSHYENDLSLATGCSGVVDGEVVQLPDPGASGLVPTITIDQRLNFLIRIHTALFKLLGDGGDYPGRGFLVKFKALREERIDFDHPSLDLLEIVLEDTVDWRRYVVKRNLFKIPGFHPGVFLTERIIGNSLTSLKEEYKSRWNSLVGDCVLPMMLSKSEWSDDRFDLSEKRERKHRVNNERRENDGRESRRSRVGESALSRRNRL